MQFYFNVTLPKLAYRIFLNVLLFFLHFVPWSTLPMVITYNFLANEISIPYSIETNKWMYPSPILVWCSDICI